MEITTKQAVSTSALLGKYADLMNKYGPDAPQANEFLQKHADNEEFVQLARTANSLKTKIVRYQAQLTESRRGASQGRRR